MEMVKYTKSYRFMKRSFLVRSLFVFIPAFLMLFYAGASFAVAPEAETGLITSIIEGIKVRQIGSDEIILELRGTKMNIPAQIKDESLAAVLRWKGIRFPRDTDKKDWWDEYGWSVLRLDPVKSEEWWQRYDYPLAQRVQVVSNDMEGVDMKITGEKPLKVSKVIGMPGSDNVKIYLKAETDIVPPAPQPKRAVEKGDPMGMYSPVTLELREVSVREVFRLLADLRNLNLVIDSSVPDNLMTFSFKNAKFSEVFAYMLRMNDLTYALMGKTLVVGTAESIGKTLGKNEAMEYKVAY